MLIFITDNHGDWTMFEFFLLIVFLVLPLSQMLPETKRANNKKGPTQKCGPSQAKLWSKTSFS